MISNVWKHEQDLSEEGILEQFPAHVRELLESILQEGFILTLVGGAVRDYFINHQLSKDLDFELRHPYQYDESEWSFRLGRLEERLQEVYGYSVELLSFSVMRVHWEDHDEDVELAPARVESYDNSDGLGHSDMEVLLVSNRDYRETFARRDFSLNAMGIEFYKKETELKVRFIDPFEGLKDLTQKSLVPCGDNFSKDPVRFCRAIRFALKFNLKFSTELINSFSHFNLSALTSFYFFREAFKVDFFHFAEIFYEWVARANIAISEELEDLKFLSRIGIRNLDLSSASEVLLFLIYHKGKEGEEATYKQIELFAKVAKLKSSLIDRHLNLKATLEELQSIDVEGLKLTLKEMSFEEFQQFPHKSALKRFHMSMNRFGGENKLFLLGRLNSHLYSVLLKYEKLLPETLEGKDDFQSMIDEQAIAPEKRSDALYFCHFKSLN